MFDRRLVTDVGLAILIAVPFILPSAPSPRSAGAAQAEISAPAREAIQARYAEASRSSAIGRG
ncbi:MAG TPA: hypothetical protein VFP53_07430 [Sphingomicrobium sp.]|nr:hypothetical protein [Sphingomicrobium sp.]